MPSLAYFQRILSAYIGGTRSQLSFWHELPEINLNARYDSLGPYYMSFSGKANIAGPFDEHGVLLLDYRGTLGKQYNPIAIAQYGLALLNRWHTTHENMLLEKAIAQGRWLTKNLRTNIKGCLVWMHEFDFEYDPILRKPWYSGLAQGAGISLLLRLSIITSDDSFARTALLAASALSAPLDQGGVMMKDSHGCTWIEEYIVDPPSHILNGFIWTLWGVHDLWLVTREGQYKNLFDASCQTIRRHLPDYDLGWWSAYQLKRPWLLPMLASPYYHQLHCVQLEILSRMAANEFFHEYAMKWQNYWHNAWYRTRAFLEKGLFKLLYY